MDTQNSKILEMVRKFEIDNRPPPFEEFQKSKSLLEEYFKQIGKWISDHRAEILLAWWATYGFEPGKAEVITVYEPNGTRVYVRESAVPGAMAAQPTTAKAQNAETGTSGI